MIGGDGPATDDDTSLAHLALLIHVTSTPGHITTDDERAAHKEAADFWRGLTVDQRLRVSHHLAMLHDDWESNRSDPTR